MALPLTELRRQALRANARFILGMGVMLFLPAWSLNYWQAWLYWLLFSALTLAGTLYFLKHDPKLVERRLAVGPAAETEKTQKIIMIVASLCFILSVVIPGLDHLLHWSNVPTALALVGDAIVAAGFLIMYWVVHENSYAAGIIRVESGQPVISTGPYALVRHPMYSGGLLMVGFTPLALGSAWGTILFIPCFAGLAWRLLEEERFLIRNLSGYAEYCRRTRYRLIPFVW